MTSSRRFRLSCMVVGLTLTTVTRAEITVSGRVGELPGVRLMGFPGQTPCTDDKGLYTTQVPHGWSGTVTPVKEGCEFDPHFRVYEDLHKPFLNDNYEPRVRACKISGSIVFDGTPIPGVLITLSNGAGQCMTDHKGRYALEVPYGWSGSLVPSKKGHLFDPPEKRIDKVTHDTVLDSGDPSPVPPMGQAGPNVLIVPTSRVDAIRFDTIFQDARIMLHILEKALSRRKGLLVKSDLFGELFADYGALPIGDKGMPPQAIYLQGYGLILSVRADLAEPPPDDPSGEPNRVESTEIDPAWRQAREELMAASDAAPIKRTGTTSPAPGWPLADLIEELIGALRRATNIRDLAPEEVIIISVTRPDNDRTRRTDWRRQYPSGSLNYQGGAWKWHATEFRTAPAAYMIHRALTLQATKSDIDDFAAGKLSLDQFRQKVSLFAY